MSAFPRLRSLATASSLHTGITSTPPTGASAARLGVCAPPGQKIQTGGTHSFWKSERRGGNRRSSVSRRGDRRRMTIWRGCDPRSQELDMGRPAPGRSFCRVERGTPGFVLSHPSEAWMGHPFSCWAEGTKSNRRSSFDFDVRRSGRSPLRAGIRLRLAQVTRQTSLRMTARRRGFVPSHPAAEKSGRMGQR